MPGQATVTIRDKQWHVYLATTPQELIQGLGGLPSIEPGTGMLLCLPSMQAAQMTTAPMLFPIDVVWMDYKGRVVDLDLNISPGYLLTPAEPVTYILEVNAGEAQGVEVGDEALIEVTVSPHEANMQSAVQTGVVLGIIGLLSTFFGGMMRAITRALKGGKKKLVLMPKTAQVQYLPKADEGGEYTWTLWDPETGEYMAKGGFSTVERAKRDAARFATRRAREIGSWLPLVLWIHQIPARELEIGRLDETAVFKGKLEPELEGPRYLPQSFRIEVSAFGPSKVITEGMPKLPEEAYKDWYFVKYIRDLCAEVPVSEDKARWYWNLWKQKKEYEEKYKEQIEEEWEEKKRRWLEEERGRSPKLLGPERKEEPPEEVRYFADSKDHIEDSVNRNNLRSMLEEAFKEAIARAAEKKIGEIWR